MIIKRRTKSLSLRKLDAIITRISIHGNHSLLRELKKQAAKEYKGYIGERKVDYFLDILANQATILQGVYLRTAHKNFQIDTVLITDHVIFCIESKNFDRTITFDTIHKQLTRSNGDQEEGYRYPITQAETQQYFLMKWLQEHNLHSIPIHYFIAISEPSTIVKVIGDQESIARVVAHAELLPKKVMAVHEKIRMNGKEKINRNLIGMRIFNHCKEQDFDILGKFSIKKGDILPGVECSKCGRLGMVRMYGKWKCPKCGHESKYAHKKAIADYLLLFGPTITNQACRQFLNIDCRALATRILQSCGLEYQIDHKRWIKLDG